MQSITVIAMDKDGYAESFVIRRSGVVEVEFPRSFGWMRFIVRSDDVIVYEASAVVNTVWNDTAELVRFAEDVFSVADLYVDERMLAYIDKCLYERRCVPQSTWESTLTCTAEEFMRFMRDKLIDSGVPEDVLPYIDMDSYVDHVIERNDLYCQFTGLLTGVDYVTERYPFKWSSSY